MEAEDLTPGELVTWENHPYIAISLSEEVNGGYTSCMRLWDTGPVDGFYERANQKKMHISLYKYNSLARFRGVFLKEQTECVQSLSEDLVMCSQVSRVITLC